MKILFLSNCLPYPLETGGNARSIPILKALCSKHEVSVISFIESDQEKAYLPELQKLCTSVETIPFIIRMGRIPFLRPFTALKSLFSKDAYFLYKFRSSEMRQKIQETLASRPFDLIFADHLVMCPFIESVRNIPRVLHEHNAEYLSVLRFAQSTSNPFKKLFAWIDQYKLRKYEARVCAQMHRILAVSEEVGEELAALTDGAANITVVRSGVDTNYWRPLDTPFDSNTISFLGHMGYPPNTHAVLWFVQKVLPLLKRRLPAVRFQVIGSNPPREIKALDNGTDVKVTGYVLDVRPLLGSSAVSVFPIFFGGGVKIKVLISLAMGIPSVSTRIGCEGIDVEDGRSIFFAEAPEPFAEKILALMLDQERRKAMSDEGLRLMEREYTEDLMHRRVLATIDEFTIGGSHDNP